MNDFSFQLLLLMIGGFFTLVFFAIMRLILFINNKFSNLINQIQSAINNFNELINSSKTKNK